MAVQQRVGVREQADELLGSFRSSVPPAVAEFLSQHTFAVLSSTDGTGNVWASPVAGPAGILSADESTAIIHLDRLDPKLEPDFASGGLAALLVIHFDRRLRLRINGSLDRTPDALKIHVGQLYGNCTKYIQRRIPATDARVTDRVELVQDSVLTEAQRQWIARSDTFFIATFVPESGADASHRGGRPGFVTALDESTVIWPDYRGNNMFNTLGNLENDARAGLLFIDFDSGASLQLTGKAVADFGDPSSFTPTGRSMRFEVSTVRELPPAASLRYALVEAFPYNPPVG